ncbi:MAG: helicase-related protein, partial [Gemmatimonadota bacterium]|nr:helicase-related protein [Gemmatimonadota bacterium]
ALRRPVRVVTSFDRPNIFWDTDRVPQGAGRVRRLARVLSEHGRSGHGAAIVYAPTRNQVVTLRRVLAAKGLGAEAYHAGMTPEERKGVQDRFLQRASNLVVATNAFGMGIDRGDVGCVVHYGFPGSLESYYQEAGRAGRDGEPSRALAFVCRRDWRVPRGFVDRSFPSPGTVRRVLRRLRRSSRRRNNGLRGRELTGRFDEHVPALRWLIRDGALEANEALERLAVGEAGVERRQTALAEGCLTGRVPDLGVLAAARADALARLEAARRYTASRGCRRRVLLGYLGEVPQWRRCGGCDRCAEGGATPAK